jgi:hypothetical protein
MALLKDLPGGPDIGLNPIRAGSRERSEPPPEEWAGIRRFSSLPWGIKPTAVAAVEKRGSLKAAASS